MGNLSNFVKRVRDIMRNDAGINGDAQRIEQIAWMLFLKVYDSKEDEWNTTFDSKESYQSIIPESCRWRNWAHAKNGKGMTGDTLLEFVNNTLFPTLKKLPVDASTPIKKAIVQTTFADANNYMKDGVLLRQIINEIDDIKFDEYEESRVFAGIYETILRELQSAGSAGEFYTPRAVTDFMAQMIDPQIGEKMADFACGTGGFLTSWLKVLRQKIQTTTDENLCNNSIYGVEKKQFPYILCITNMLLHDVDVPQVFHDNTLLRDVLDYTEDDQVDVILMNPPYGGSEKPEIKNHFPADLASSETADLFMSVMHIIEISFWRDKICCYLHYGKEAHPLPVFWNLKRQLIIDTAFNSIDLLIIRIIPSENNGFMLVPFNFSGFNELLFFCTDVL